MTAKVKKIPEQFEAEMTQEDINIAFTTMMNDEPTGVCETCPVAQVLMRMFPDYQWAVGFGEAEAVSPKGEMARYRIDDEARKWIMELPGSFGWGQDSGLVRPLGKFTLTLHMPEDA